MGFLSKAFGYESPAKKAREAADKAYYAEQARLKKLQEEQERLQAAALQSQKVQQEKQATAAGEEQTILQNWAWTKKYLQAQRQVAQAKAVKPPPEPVEELTIEKVALPAAGVGLAWWFLKG